MSADTREEVIEGLKKATIQLYPVLTEKGTMQILDGKSRKQADPNWPERAVTIADPKDRILIPMYANYRRRVSRKETQAQLIQLASMLTKEGVERGQIVAKLIEITPYKRTYIQALLPAKFKQVEHATRKKISVDTTPVIKKGPSTSTAPVEKIVPRGTICPSCKTEIETVLCPRCLKEFPAGKLK